MELLLNPKVQVLSGESGRNTSLTGRCSGGAVILYSVEDSCKGSTEQTGVNKRMEENHWLIGCCTEMAGQLTLRVIVMSEAGTLAPLASLKLMSSGDSRWRTSITCVAVELSMRRKVS